MDVLTNMYVQFDSGQAVVGPGEVQVLEKLLDFGGDDVGGEPQDQHAVPEAAQTVEVAGASSLGRREKSWLLIVVDCC